jgi:hypothetical protein
MKKMESITTFTVVWSMIGGLVVLLMLGRLVSSGRPYEMVLLEQAASPDETFVASLYMHLSGGAAGTVYMRGYVINAATGENRRIYTSFRRGSFSVEWLDDITVVINGVEIDAMSGTYGNVGSQVTIVNLIVAGGIYIAVIVLACLHINHLKKLSDKELTS